MPALIALMKTEHKLGICPNHLAAMCGFVPARYRCLLPETERLPPLSKLASSDSFNAIQDAMAAFREVHYGWAGEYVYQRVEDPRGTGGTPYMTWLKQLMDETKAARRQPH